MPTPDPRNPASNVTLSPQQKEELAKLRKKQLANAVHYIWETGEDKFMLRYFHTGFWLSCEKHNEGWWVEQTLIRDQTGGFLCLNNLHKKVSVQHSTDFFHNLKMTLSKSQSQSGYVKVNEAEINDLLKHV